MKSLKSSIAIAAAILATTSMAGAHAADEQKQPAAGSAQLVRGAEPQAKPESRQFEIFENELYRMSVPSYTPSEHPDAKPAPRSAHVTPSVFDDPKNTASLG